MTRRNLMSTILRLGVLVSCSLFLVGILADAALRRDLGIQPAEVLRVTIAAVTLLGAELLLCVAALRLAPWRGGALARACGTAAPDGSTGCRNADDTAPCSSRRPRTNVTSSPIHSPSRPARPRHLTGVSPGLSYRSELGGLGAAGAAHGDSILLKVDLLHAL